MSPAQLPVVQDGSLPLALDDADDFLCARCARRQETCCQRTDIVTTLGDIERIAAHIGRRDFTELRPAGSPAYLDQDDDPLWLEAVFRPDGTRRVVKWQANGDCSFLGPVGCTLPADVRPLICRLYPFDYNEQGLKAELATGCPSHLLPEGVGLSDALRMDRSVGERWHAMLYDELRAEVAGRTAGEAA